MTHLVASADLTRERVLHLFALAADLKQRWKAGRRGAPLGFSRPRRHSCPNFYVTHGSGGRIPVDAPHLLRSLAKQEGTVSRCRVRGGVHLDSGYVTDLCLTGQYRDCVFYEDEQD